MIVNVTYPDRITKRQMEKLVGTSFSFLERIKRRGIGSEKLQIVEASQNIAQYITRTQDTNYCNLELREKGIVVGFHDVMKIYAWCIPYYQLSIYVNGGKLSIYGPKGHIKAIPAFNQTLNRKFLKKVMAEKQKYSGLW